MIVTTRTFAALLGPYPGGKTSKVSTSRVLVTALLSFIATTAAAASPKCMRGQQPFALKDDAVTWSMALQGTECIQGLRWPYMQIYSVAVATPPKHGTVVIVGSGFRYAANPVSEANGDAFKLVVVGKNGQEPGSSTIEVIVASKPVPR